MHILRSLLRTIAALTIFFLSCHVYRCYTWHKRYTKAEAKYQELCKRANTFETSGFQKSIRTQLRNINIPRNKSAELVSQAFSTNIWYKPSSINLNLYLFEKKVKEFEEYLEILEQGILVKALNVRGFSFCVLCSTLKKNVEL